MDNILNVQVPAKKVRIWNNNEDAVANSRQGMVPQLGSWLRTNNSLP